MSDVVDAVVIGAGVVGLAVARELAMRGREVIVLEKNRAIGEETAARNSEVIHAGIYYPTGSLKARLCVEGRQRLYAILLGERYSAPTLRQADRRGARRAAARELEALGANRARERRRRPRGGRRARQSRALEPAVRGRRGTLVAVDRDRRQPRADARVPRRPRARGRIDRAARPLRGRRARRRGHALVVRCGRRHDGG